MSGVSVDVVVRPAVPSDAPFLVETIIEAEKSSTDKLSYSEIFDLSEMDVRRALLDILREDIDGQELCISGFMVAESAGALAGAACAWVEGKSGLPSGVIKGNLLMHHFGRERFLAAAERIRVAEQIGLPRRVGSLQFESVYVSKQYRKLGVVSRILQAQEQAAILKAPEVTFAQIILLKANERALKSYGKYGFRVAMERTSEVPEILDLLPGRTKVLMEKLVAP